MRKHRIEDPPTAATVQAAETGSGAQRPWHALVAEEAMAELGVGSEGLSQAAVARRLVRFGPNRLQIEPPVSARKVLAAQVRSLVVALLLAAALIALALGDLVEAVTIGAVLVINTGIGFWTEWRARRAMEALRNLQVQAAVVRRQGEVMTLDAVELVPGDLILLEAGSAIPADARLVEANELMAVEAPLTGESQPTLKRVAAVGGDDPMAVPLGDRLSMVFKGTLVAAGSGEAVVVGTGARTEIGRISELLQGADEERSPLERQLDRLGRRLVGVVLALATLVVALGVWRGYGLWPMLEMGIALAIAAVPEGLPVVATITLAVSVRRMVARHALLRRLPSVETLGSATVICTDKTGTLTAGEMTATVLHVAGGEIEVTGAGYEEAGELLVDGRRVGLDEVPGLELALEICVLVNNARLVERGSDRLVEGDPTEAALLVLGRKAGVEREALLQRLPRLFEVPFSSERMLMATFHGASPEAARVLVKGAPGKIIDLASRVLDGSEVALLDQRRRERLLEVNRLLAAGGLRVLALAARDLETGESPAESALHDLTFVGFVGLMDPPAPRVRETVQRLRSAGIRTVMITGDQMVTAEAIAKQLGVLDAGDATLDGRAMLQLTEEQLAAKVEGVTTFARIGPEDKLRIVRALQRRGDIVGMLGDGVNDAPALKQADIGVAMGGRGTDVAKETADMVLADDRFESVAAAVEEGRVAFDNIRKFVFYLFSCNLSEALVVVVGVVAGLPAPLLPLQILWLNLITDIFPALALAAEPAEPGVMRREPRDPKAAILSASFARRVASYGLVITAATLAAFLWSLQDGSGDPRRPGTMAFMTLALAQLLHVFNARGKRAARADGRVASNPWIWRALLLTVLLQLAALYMPPLSAVLQTVPLELADWGVVVLASSLPLILGQGARARRPAAEPSRSV